ncbi:MAG: hypothetical protein LQ338_002086 [Usnochroma carphineum]|nr:MAG: hypothetical protein LQ338_002086 [Usnochroma carphineum]
MPRNLLNPIVVPASLSDPPPQCKEFCKTDIIDGQVQVNAPGVLIPPSGGGGARL